MIIKRINELDCKENDLLLLSHTKELAFALYRDESYYIYDGFQSLKEDLNDKFHYLKDKKYIKYNKLRNYSHFINYGNCENAELEDIRKLLIEKVDFINSKETTVSKPGDIIVTSNFDYYIYLGKETFNLKIYMGSNDEMIQTQFNKGHKYLQLNNISFDFESATNENIPFTKELRLETLKILKSKKKFKRKIGFVSFEKLEKLNFRYRHIIDKGQNEELDFVTRNNENSIEILNNYLHKVISEKDDIYDYEEINSFIAEKIIVTFKKI